jgi:LysR family transcriptional activator of nhaA
VAVVAAGDLALKYRRMFPKSLDGAPFLLPTANTSLRRSLEHWFAVRGVRPAIQAEFEDSALLKVFGEAGDGLFVIPTVIEEEVRRSHDLRLVGRIESVRIEYYAITLEQKLQHPGVVAIVEPAHGALFS